MKLIYKIKRMFKSKKLKILWIVIPTAILVAYAILEYTGDIYKLNFDVNWAVYTGYDLFLSKAGVRWLKSVDHSVLSGITIGLVQVLCIAIGFIIDAIITIVLFFLSLLFALLLLFLQITYIYVLPVLILILVIFKSKSMLKGTPPVLTTLITVSCLLISIISVLSFYANSIPNL